VELHAPSTKLCLVPLPRFAGADDGMPSLRSGGHLSPLGRGGHAAISFSTFAASFAPTTTRGFALVAWDIGGLRSADPPCVLAMAQYAISGLHRLLATTRQSGFRAGDL
jgi:hypothetical protein